MLATRFHRNPKPLGDMAKCGSELLVLRFREVIHILATVVTEKIAHGLILQIASFSKLPFGV